MSFSIGNLYTELVGTKDLALPTLTKYQIAHYVFFYFLFKKKKGILECTYVKD